MNRTLMFTVAVLPHMVLACSADAPSRPEQGTQLTAATAPLPYLLPEETIVAIEIRDLSRRWLEVRETRVLADIQDRILDAIHLQPDMLLAIAGNRAVLALVHGDEGRAILPIALLLPPDVGRAEAELATVAPSWSVISARGALWAGPSGMADWLQRVALGNGSSLAQAIPLSEVDERLPTGGLVRGWVNPKAIRRAIQASARERLPAWVDLGRELIAAELDAVRWIGFRRDVKSDRVTTDAVIAYDTRILPAEFSEVLARRASSPRIPAALPDDVVVAASFRLEAQVALPWLRFIAASDPAGPFRNLEFWLREFEGRTRLSVEDDLFGSFGEHGWLLAFESVEAKAPPWVVVLQAPNADRAETTMLALLDWSAEHAWLRTLGAAVPEVRDEELEEGPVHTFVLSTPVKELFGPSFAAVERFLVFGANPNSVQLGIDLIQSGAFPDETLSTARPAPQGSLTVLGSLLARLATSLAMLANSTTELSEEMAALVDVVANVRSLSCDIHYEVDALRLSGEVLLTQ